MPAPPRPTFESTTSSLGGGRRVLPRNKDFLNKHGHRHHSFDPEKAPYPLSYDRQVLELESMDHSFVMHVKKSVSVVPFTDGPPTRSLDLGCGGGTWILEAAKEWPECEFVGFDLVDVQVPLAILDQEIANRVTWVHGNFLTTKLPFDDDEFDHVHMHSLGRGIPENKWGVLFEEVNRVLSPGGVVEVLEHDIIFPTLPSWFTAPLRVRNKRADSIHHPNGSQHRAVTPPPLSPDLKPPAHDHALLESLYYAVFENRFINLRPTAILPIHFTSNFRQVISAPIVHFRMPALPPLQALPQPLPPNALLLGGDSDKSETSSQPTASPDVPPTPRPISVSFSSTDSRRTSNSASTGTSSLFDRSYSVSDTTTHLTSSPGECNSPTSPTSVSIPGSSSKTACITKRPLYTVDSSAAESTTGTSSSQSLIPLDEIDKLNESSLAMQLYWSYQCVLACQESMWEELADRMRNRQGELRELGWESDLELSELESRAKFEVLVERYKRDMQARISLWCSLSELGWAVPPREPLSKAELVEEERLYQAMLEARRFASEEDLQTPSRSVRIFVGYKGC
ncbi:hypothetical protein HYDPIDRAFT_86952 [Hydnomerulius pinastri MD-312]|nr:hypothetical protein HYDPIDRAFT_86952 [Hydnomerulius pinastri MD-312]